MFLQEHCKFDEQFNEFLSLGDVCYCGSSSMDSHVPLVGRPHGGSAIIWRNTFKHKVTPLKTNSNRLSAVTISLPNDVVILAINAYMPCDSRSTGCNYETLMDTIDEIQNVIVTTHSSCIVIGGDLNCDFGRNTPHVKGVKDFINASDLRCGTDHVIANVPYTFESKGTGARSTIDHFILNKDLFGTIKEYHSFDLPENMSDHVAVMCSLDMQVAYYNSSEKLYTPKPSWVKSTAVDIDSYQYELDIALQSVPLPHEAIVCQDPYCNKHETQIDEFNTNIINACLVACNKAIPKTSKPRRNRNVPGWNEFVKDKCDTAYFWHQLWKDNGRSRDGELAKIMRMTRNKYHYAIRQCRRNELAIKTTRIAERLAQGQNSDFWTEVRRLNTTSKHIASTVDGCNNPTDIADIFHKKFESLYTSVPYDVNDMKNIKQEVTSRIDQDLIDLQKTGKFPINSLDIAELTFMLKRNKDDGHLGLSTDCIIYGSHKLYVYLSMLYNCVLLHGFIPSELRVGTMSPIPKCRSGANCSDKYRAITLSSCIGRLLDLLILTREGEKSLKTDNLQFGYKKKSSTTLCTGLLKEIVNHFTSGDSNIYLLCLDASKAFDRVEYVKLFSGLLKRNINSVYLRCLINLYTNQKLCVKWNNYKSSMFTAKNGVKQGGILSPLLFGTYMDELLAQLRSCGAGCYMGPYWCGALSYADDFCLVSPSIDGLNRMIAVCNDFSAKYNVSFNGDKSQLIKFTSNRRVVDRSSEYVLVKGCKVTCTDSVTYLGHILHSDPHQDDLQSVVKNFNKQFNIFRAKFQCVTPNVRNSLFVTYCTSLYGIQLCDLQKSHKLHVTYRKAIRTMWGLPYRTHCSLLPCITRSLCSIHMCSKRFLNFAANALQHESPVVKYIFNNALSCKNSVFAKNLTFCTSQLNLQADYCHRPEAGISVHQAALSACRERCFSTEDIALGLAIRDCVLISNRQFDSVLTPMEAFHFVSHLCVN
jgi:hypothetical protein